MSNRYNATHLWKLFSNQVQSCQPIAERIDAKNVQLLSEEDLETYRNLLQSCLDEVKPQMNSGERKYAQLAAENGENADDYFSQLEEITEAGYVYGFLQPALDHVKTEIAQRNRVPEQKNEEKLTDGYMNRQWQRRRPRNSYRRF
jgi:hypothetical protein